MVGFIVLRLVATVISGLGVEYGTPVSEIDPAARDMLDEPALDEGIDGWLLGPWQRQDALRYLRVARDGYDAPVDSVFAPLYPSMIRAVSLPLGDDGQARLIAALLISNVAAVVAFALFLRLVSYHFGDVIARRSFLALLIFPTSFFFVAAYSESLFLCFTLASLLRLEQGRPVQAGVFGGLAAATRNAGWVLTIPLLWSVWTRRREIWARGPFAALTEVTAAGLPAAAFAGFLVYRRSIGLPGISSVYENEWLTTTAWPGKALLRAIGWIATGTVPSEYGVYFYIDVFAMLTAIVVCVWGHRHLPTSWWLYSVASTFFLLLPDSLERTVNSTGRYLLVLFPAFVLLAHIRLRAVRLMLGGLAALVALAFIWSSAQWFWVA